MQRGGARNHDATRRAKLAIGVPEIPLDSVGDPMDRMEPNEAVMNPASQPPKKRLKLPGERPTAQSLANPSEESEVPTLMGGGDHVGGILRETKPLQQTETSAATVSRQMQFMFSPRQTPDNSTDPETGGRQPTSDIGTVERNAPSHFRSQQRNETESVSALVASPPTGSIPLDFAAMSAHRLPEALNYGPSLRREIASPQSSIVQNMMEQELIRGLHISDISRYRAVWPMSNSANSFGLQDVNSDMLLPNTSNSTGTNTMYQVQPPRFESMPLNYASMSAHAPPGALNYRPHLRPEITPQNTSLPNSTEQQHRLGTYPAVGSNYFQFQDAQLDMASLHSTVLSNTNNSTGIGTMSQFQQTRTLENERSWRQEPQQQNPIFGVHLTLGNGGSASIEQHLPTGLSIRPPISHRLPATLSHPNDILHLNAHQVYLREQIEVFEATPDDLNASARGRSRRIHVGQVGIRCRHCAHIPAQVRQMGAMYFPATMHGLYQAAQNMSTNHIQCGLCSEMPESVKTKFVELLPTKKMVSRVGVRYWEEGAERLGLVDTEDGIAFQPNPGLR